MNFSRLLLFLRQFQKFFDRQFDPILERTGLTIREVHVLLFLGNNPAYKTASDIVEIRHIKANLVSVNVDRLVQDGYLVRNQVRGDRRKTELVRTDKAQPVIEKGRQLQGAFFERLFADVDEETRRAFAAAMQRIEEKLDAILEADE